MVSVSIVSDTICQSLTTLKSNAVPIMKCFEEKMEIDSMNDINVFTLIKKNKYLCFENTNFKNKERETGKQKELTCQGDVLGLLDSASYKTEKPVDT